METGDTLSLLPVSIAGIPFSYAVPEPLPGYERSLITTGL